METLLQVSGLGIMNICRKILWSPYSCPKFLMLKQKVSGDGSTWLRKNIYKLLNLQCNLGLISPLGANEITSMELKELWLLMRYFYSMNLVAVKFSLDNAHFAVQILLWVIYLIISRPSADCDCSEKKTPFESKSKTQSRVPRLCC